MPNIATVLKSEIGRLARREVRGETEALKKASAQYRSEIAALKRRIAAMEKQIKRVGRGAAPAASGRSEAESEDGESQERRRFSAKGLAKHRQRLGLSAEAFGKLVGVTGQSIYKWEAGKARPRAAQVQAIAAIRTLGKREAQARLEQLGS
ncbi:MAG TPA: helix-turn-helix transcriptional regulator [Ramlibacter sp.]|nr:helix-turn-helix transcriptional regulator [Ramlibacter sp.]